MKIKDDPPTAAQLTQSDTMNTKSFTPYSKAKELIDVCMDALREEDRGSQGSSSHSTLGTQCGRTADRSLASTMGEFDVDELQPFYPQCERTSEVTAPRSMTVGDSSGDETFAAEILSPMNASFGMADVASAARWSSHRGGARGGDKQTDSHAMETVSDGRSMLTGGHPSQARCSRVGRRFLSSEAIRPGSDCSRMEKTLITTRGRQATGDFVAGGIQRKRKEYDTNDFAAKNDNTSAHEDFRQVTTSLSSVMREIDIAVSMAHSRFKDVDRRSGNATVSTLPNQAHVRPKFGTQPGPHVAVYQPNKRADACPPMTKDYASHNMRARSTEDEWKRKSDYGSAAPAAHELTASFEQSRSSDVFGHLSVVGGVSYSAPDCERNSGNAEVVPCESAESGIPSSLDFETKINSERDERNTASYAVGASLLRAQSPTHEAYWPQMRTYEEQVLARLSGRSGAGGAHIDVSSTSEVENKPINLCLQQGRNRESELGPDVASFESTKAPEFRKCARSFSTRQKPYQIPKRRTRSQCSVSPVSSSSLTGFEPGFADARPGSSRQSSARDMGIDNRTALENYTKESNRFLGGHGTFGDSNSIGIFPSSEASHMMVQDEAKTYAILSGRCNEDLMNPHTLTSGSPHQQHSLYQQARHSHSIINYAGPHGQSPDLRTTDMSPSPPIRDHRATPSSSLPGILPPGKGFPNVIVAPRQHQHSGSPSQRNDFHDMFQRQYESSGTTFDLGLQDSRRHLHQHHSLALGSHPSTSTFSPLHISPPQYHHQQQQSQYLVKHHQKKDYFDNFPSHSGLATSTSITPFAGTLQVAQHHGYLKPPPVDLDDLSDDERERMRVKRERNRVAAAKCRNRRRELLERLEKEAEQLEREQELLRENVRRLRVQKLQLGNMLEEHEPKCDKNVAEEMPSKSASDQEMVSANIEQPKSDTSGVLDNGESSIKNTTSPVQLSTQA